MNLVIDSGNSAAKVGIFNQQKLVGKFTFAVLEELYAFVRSASYENLLISSVNADAHEIASQATIAGKKIHPDEAATVAA